MRVSVGLFPSSTSFAASAIHWLDRIEARGPQKSKSGNVPSWRCSSSRSEAGRVWTAGIFRPSAGYIGRGVTATSTDEYMLNHQNRLAHVKLGSISRARTQRLGAWTRRLDWRQNFTSHSSRKYHPLPTMPCWSGRAPVRDVAWPEQLTAGVTDCTVATRAPRVHWASRGVARPTRSRVSPTTLSTMVLFISAHQAAAAGATAPGRAAGNSRRTHSNSRQIEVR